MVHQKLNLKIIIKEQFKKKFAFKIINYAHFNYFQSNYYLIRIIDFILLIMLRFQCPHLTLAILLMLLRISYNLLIRSPLIILIIYFNFNFHHSLGSCLAQCYIFQENKILFLIGLITFILINLYFLQCFKLLDFYLLYLHLPKYFLFY